jgi:hypothetical protein
MTENTSKAACSESDFIAARQAGLLVVTTEDELAVHRFAEVIRNEAYANGYAAAVEFIATGSAPALSGWVMYGTGGDPIADDVTEGVCTDAKP